MIWESSNSPLVYLDLSSCFPNILNSFQLKTACPQQSAWGIQEIQGAGMRIYHPHSLNSDIVNFSIFNSLFEMTKVYFIFKKILKIPQLSPYVISV